MKSIFTIRGTSEDQGYGAKKDSVQIESKMNIDYYDVDTEDVLII